MDHVPLAADGLIVEDKVKDILMFPLSLHYFFASFAKHFYFGRGIDCHDPCIAESASFNHESRYFARYYFSRFISSQRKRSVHFADITRLSPVHMKLIHVAWDRP